MTSVSSKQSQTKPKITTKSAPSVIATREPTGDLEERLQWIATAAYYKAAGRGFVPGEELNDWLEAELELDGTNKPMK